MCLALVAINLHPFYPLIVLSNRDEFYNRATIPAHFWPEAPNLFAGKDLAAGGTWLGVNQQGGFSLITNYRNPNIYDVALCSRGLLVKNYLLESIRTSPASYLQEILPSVHCYNPFNLLVGTIDELIYYSNVENKVKKLTHGLYGISNHLLDSPWYKLLKAKKLFNQSLDKVKLSKHPESIEELLFPILANRTLAPDHLLPQTGVPIDLEKLLSSIFVNVPNVGYGTRSSTLILFGKNTIFFSEKTFSNGALLSWSRTNIK